MESGGGRGGGNKDENSLESGGTGGSHHYHHRFSSKYLPLILTLCATLALLSMIHYQPANSFQFFPTSYNPSNTLANNDVELERVLKEAAMEDRTVILTVLNQAWAEPNSVFDIFLEGFKTNNETKMFLNNLVVITLDEQAYARCVAIHPHCYDLRTNGTDFSGEAPFMSPEYLFMMWRRIDFLRTVLDLGYNFIFTDTDIIWFRNPFPHFYSDADFQITCDFFRGNPSDIISNLPNGGYTYVKSNKRTVDFYKFWYKSRETYPGMHDQDVLNKIKNDTYLTKIKIKIKFLDTAYFGGFCEPSKDLNKVCTMHANCCIGLDNKIFDLNIMLDDWRKYSSAKANRTKSLKSSSWTVPQRCGAASFSHHDPPKKNATEGTKR